MACGGDLLPAPFRREGLAGRILQKPQGGRFLALPNPLGLSGRCPIFQRLANTAVSLPCRSEQPDLAQSAPTARDHIGMGARIEWVYGHTPRFSEVLRTRWMAMTSAAVRRSGGSSSGAFGCSACHCFR